MNDVLGFRAVITIDEKRHIWTFVRSLQQPDTVPMGRWRVDASELRGCERRSMLRR